MATFNKIQAFAENVYEKVHNMGADALTFALTAAANAPVNTNTILANLTQIIYTNLSTRVPTISSSAQTSGTYKLVLTDLVLSASGGAANPFRYSVLYNDTSTSPADPLIGWYDYGSDLTLASGESLTYDFDGTNGVLQHA